MTEAELQIARKLFTALEAVRMVCAKDRLLVRPPALVCASVHAVIDEVKRDHPEIAQWVKIEVPGHG